MTETRVSARAQNPAYRACKPSEPSHTMRRLRSFGLPPSAIPRRRREGRTEHPIRDRSPLRPGDLLDIQIPTIKNCKASDRICTAQQFGRTSHPNKKRTNDASLRTRPDRGATCEGLPQQVPDQKNDWLSQCCAENSGNDKERTPRSPKRCKQQCNSTLLSTQKTRPDLPVPK